VNQIIDTIGITNFIVLLSGIVTIVYLLVKGTIILIFHNPSEKSFNRLIKRMIVYLVFLTISLFYWPSSFPIGIFYLIVYIFIPCYYIVSDIFIVLKNSDT